MRKVADQKGMEVFRGRLSSGYFLCRSREGKYGKRKAVFSISFSHMFMRITLRKAQINTYLKECVKR